MSVVDLLSHLCNSRADLRYGVDSLSNHAGHLSEAHVRVDIHLPVNCFNFLGIELAKVVNDAIEFFGILSGLNLCKNLISCLFSLGVFSCDLSKASVDFRVGSQGLNLVLCEFGTKLGEKLVLILKADLAQEGTEVVKIFSRDAGQRFSSFDLGEFIFSFTSKVGV